MYTVITFVWHGKFHPNPNPNPNKISQPSVPPSRSQSGSKRCPLNQKHSGPLPTSASLKTPPNRICGQVVKVFDNAKICDLTPTIWTMDTTYPTISPKQSTEPDRMTYEFFTEKPCICIPWSWMLHEFPGGNFSTKHQGHSECTLTIHLYNYPPQPNHTTTLHYMYTQTS